jgi:hypothetical protein
MMIFFEGMMMQRLFSGQQWSWDSLLFALKQERYPEQAQGPSVLLRTLKTACARLTAAGMTDRYGDKINDPPVSLPRRLRVEPVDLFFSCRVLQLLTLEAAAQERLPMRKEIAGDLSGVLAGLKPEFNYPFTARLKPVP